MNFRKEWPKSMRFVAVLLSWLTACSGLASAQTRPSLKIVVVEGEGSVNNIQLGSGQQLVVQVRDENNAPLAGANVTFLLPERGPGGTFFGTWRNLVVTTNEQGRATGNGFRPNSTEGGFEIQVTAAQGDRTGTVNITQSNVNITRSSALPSDPLPTGGVNRIVNPFRKFGRGKIIAALLAGAIIAVAVANRGDNGDSSTTVPGTTITPGTVTVGTPR